MSKSIEALVKPELLAWARKSAGLTVDEAARKAHVKPDRLECWEKGERRPTLRQLRELARIYKRPLAVFYLPEPPRDFQPLRDFRRILQKVEGVESPELRHEIRRAWDRRDIALELYEELEGELPKFSPSAMLSDDPETLAEKIRNLLGVKREVYSGFRDKYDALNWWRAALENLGVLVFQARNIEPAEMSGFSISETPFPVIVLNIKDPVRRRIFTMLHELTHILLQDGGLCDVEEEYERAPEDQRVEVFSNRVAGAVLVPETELLQEDIVARKGRMADWANEEIEELANRFWVSRETLLRRLLICGKTTAQFYKKKKLEYEKQYKLRKAEVEHGFAPPYRLAISVAGLFFVRLALNSYYQERISAGDLSDFLNIKLRHVGRIEQEVMGRFVEFGVAS
ncbi:ImmA/IrrE family metallo-endopeptidase [Candidatus Poribacteria bacterium]|nr:ImmA/IrrE family metallo-endopeptidase [Candidatus Poribacteria bacterium]